METKFNLGDTFFYGENSKYVVTGLKLVNGYKIHYTLQDYQFSKETNTFLESDKSLQLTEFDLVKKWKKEFILQKYGK